MSLLLMLLLFSALVVVTAGDSGGVVCSCCLCYFFFSHRATPKSVRRARTQRDVISYGTRFNCAPYSPFCLFFVSIRSLEFYRFHVYCRGVYRMKIFRL